MRLATVFPLLTVLFCAPATAAMFKWTDADGNVQYGAYPPAGVDAKPIKADRAPTSSPQRKSLDEQMEALNKQREDKEKAAADAEKQQRMAEIRQTNCENAKKNIEQLNLGGHRLTHMPDGSYKRFTEEERQAQIAKNKKAIEEFCK